MGNVDSVSFRNAAGQTLFGTLHGPATGDPSLPLVALLSPGVKMRVGPGRLDDVYNHIEVGRFAFPFLGMGLNVELIDTDQRRSER